MFDLNRRLIVQRIGRRFRSNLYIIVYHTKRRPIKNTIGVSGIGLKGLRIDKSRQRVICTIIIVQYISNERFDFSLSYEMNDVVIEWEYQK